MRILSVVLVCALIACVAHALPVATNKRSARLAMPNLNRAAESKDQYLATRNELMQDELQLRTAATVVLTSDEAYVNEKLMQLKLNEISAYANGSFPPSIHLFEAKPLIEASPVFQLIQTLPKGGNLHLHSVSMVDLNWVVSTATYDPKLYTCFSASDAQQQFRFFANASLAAAATAAAGDDCPWVNVVAWRRTFASAASFDSQLYTNLTIVVDNPHEAYPTINTVWSRFESALTAVNGMVAYIPFFVAYAERALEELWRDNVQYVEFRTTLDPLYDDAGNVYTNKSFQVELLRSVVQNFTANHANDFVGAKIIYCALRHQDPSVIASALTDALQLRIQFPDFFAGFDLVGQEDPGYPLTYYLDQFFASQQQQQQAGVHLPYFFHAGETNEINEDTDNNLFDALLLNTTRIGHGYALTKHPVVLALASSKQIAVEVCPISNQVLKLVDDLRNHPAVHFLELNVPMVINSDDPSVWGLSGLSYDYYEVFMGFGGAALDLKTLKQLAMNSILYSAMNDLEKEAALQLWAQKWAEFIAYAKRQ